MDSIGSIFVGAIFIGIAAWWLVSVFVPRLRPNWRGTQQQAGTTSMIGYCLVFGCGGIAAIADMKQLPSLVSVLFLTGLLCAVIGSFVDARNPR